MPNDKKPRGLRAKENIDTAQTVVEKFMSSLMWRNPYKDKWDRFYKMYRGVLDTTNYPWQSNLWIPLSFSTVETVVPRLVSNRPQIDIMPREQGDEKYAKIMSSIIDYQWDLMNMNITMPEAVKEMCMYGTVVLKAYWSKEEGEVEEKQSVDEDFTDLGTVEVKQIKTIYNGPKCDIVDLYDFFIDPKATSIDNAEWCIHRISRPIDYLQDMAKDGKYKNINLVEGSSYPGMMDDQKQVRRSVDGVNIPTETKNDKMVELLEYWTDEKVVTVANRKIVIREEDNPYKHGKKPFIVCVDQKIPHEFYGMGELEPIESLQYELNNRRNQRMDNITLILNRMWLVLNGKGVDEDELVSDAGGVIHADSADAVQSLTLPDVTASSYQEETLIKGDIQQTSGVTDFTRGMASDALANDTATGISLLQEASNARFRLKVQNIEDMLIKRLGEMMVSMTEQFMTEEQVIRITGDEGTEYIKINPDEIRGNFDVQVVSGSTMPNNQAVANKQIMQLYQLFNGDPAVDQKELKKMVLLAINPKANTEKLFPQQQPMGMPGEMGAGMQPPEAPQIQVSQVTGNTPSATGEMMSANNA